MATPLHLTLHDPITDLAYDPEERLSRRMRSALLATALLVFGLGGMAAFVPMGAAVMANGQIGAASRIKKIAHPTGGTVAAILVQNGQRVRKGHR